MATIKVIFVHGDNCLSKVIQTATHGEWDHVGIEMLGGMLEALFNVGVTVSSLDKYTDFKTECIDVFITDPDGAEQEAKKFVGTSYGFKNFAGGGLYAIMGINISGDGEKSVDCSELVARILRAGGNNVLPNIAADNITPNDLYKALVGLRTTT